MVWVGGAGLVALWIEDVGLVALNGGTGDSRRVAGRAALDGPSRHQFRTSIYGDTSTSRREWDSMYQLLGQHLRAMMYASAYEV